MAEKDKDIGWMYEGAKSLVNREDYLLGKKVDKNFEKYSDAVNDQKPEAIDALIHTRTVARNAPHNPVKTTSLQTQVIKTEDPFVAIRVKEETKRRELLDNPLMKLKFQKMLKEMMEEKDKKKSKKDKKKKKKNKKSKSSDADDSDTEEKVKTKHKHKNREISPEPVGRRRDSTGSKNGHDMKKRLSGSNEKDKHRRSRSRSNEKKRASGRERSSSSTRTWTPEPHKRSHSPRRKSSRSPEATRKSSHNQKSRSPQARRKSSHNQKSRSPEARRKSSHNQKSRSPEARRKLSHNQSSTREMAKSSRHHNSHSPARHRERSRSPERKRDDSRKRRHDSPPPSPKRSRRSPSPKRQEKSRHRHDSSSSPSPSPAKKDKEKADKHRRRSPSRDKSPIAKKERHMDSHIPEHLRPKASTSSGSEESDATDTELPPQYDKEERERQKKFEGYGLVGVKKKEPSEDQSGENPYQLAKKPVAPVNKKPEKRRHLTEEEKAQRLAEMQGNVEWRNDTRSRNMKKNDEDDKKEEEEDSHGKAPTFIRSQMNAASDNMTMEQRLQANKKSLQRSHGYMERKFTSK